MDKIKLQRENWLKTKGITPKEFNKRVKAMISHESEIAEKKTLKKAKSRRAIKAWKDAK